MRTSSPAALFVRDVADLQDHVPCNHRDCPACILMFSRNISDFGAVMEMIAAPALSTTSVTEPCVCNGNVDDCHTDPECPFADPDITITFGTPEDVEAYRSTLTMVEVSGIDNDCNGVVDPFSPQNSADYIPTAGERDDLAFCLGQVGRVPADFADSLEPLDECDDWIEVLAPSNVIFAGPPSRHPAKFATQTVDVIGELLALANHGTAVNPADLAAVRPSAPADDTPRFAFVVCSSVGTDSDCNGIIDEGFEV